MIINSDNMVSVSDASSRGVSWLVNEAVGGRTMVVMKNNAPAAVVASGADMERLQQLDCLESDLRLWAASMVRIATDTGERHTLSDVAAEFGIDLDAEDED